MIPKTIFANLFHQYAMGEEPIKARDELESKESFEQQASEPPITLWQEFCYMVIHERKWWMIPIIASLLLIAVAVLVSTNPATSFIYTLF